MRRANTLVRFDWAIKRLLRNKANFVVLEGLLTSLLGRTIKIDRLLESEGNQEDANDKFNHVDILAEDENGELMLFEIQNNRELDYFHRMAYGTSKVVTEYLNLGDPYEKLRKVYSINIVYFSLGQGNDYAYHGRTEFVSMHDSSDVLQLSAAQRNAFGCNMPSEIFPEYYLLRVDKFDEVAKTPLDEWISFLKDGDIPVSATAPGLQEAREILRIDSLSEAEKNDYYRMMENLRYQRSVIETGRAEGREEGREEGRKEGREEGLVEGRKEGRKEGLAEGLTKGRAAEKIENARKMIAAGFPAETVLETLGLTEEDLM